MRQEEITNECPGTGQHGRMDESAPGDDWYVICHVCGTKWAGGSTLLVPHEDLRKR
ncbi:hypothetical protein JHN52_01995 [Streptomyces sp. MBT97]|uniref:hypothetical protein n=1 Tax=Streptomyces sp. MBT97 TaxID=2800411 RepID=UPI00190C43A7|nr:hypothetical protein [Streptomyces sp. MBT97]MBK3631750.1 hypothetical protein [Streptomyces sp. MBT97]